MFSGFISRKWCKRNKFFTGIAATISRAVYIHWGGVKEISKRLSFSMAKCLD